MEVIMFIILSYDVRSDRTNLFKKIAERFLTHIQNSVFRGNLTESQLLKLQLELKKQLEEDESIFLWIIKDSQIFKELKLGNSKYNDSNFL